MTKIKRQNSVSLILALATFMTGLFILTIGFVFPSIVSSSAWIGYIIMYVMIGGVLVTGIFMLKKKSLQESVWLHPPTIVTLWLVLTIGLPGIATFFDPPLYSPLQILFKNNKSYPLAGPLMFLVGISCVWISYLSSLFFTKAKHISRTLFQGEPMLQGVLGLYGLSFFAQLLRISLTGIAYGANSNGLGLFVRFSQWLSILEGLYFLVITIVARKVFRQEWPWLPLILILGLQTMLAFMSGFMKPMIWLLVVVGLAAVATKSLKQKQAMILLGILFALGVVVVPVAQGLRSQAGRFNTRSLAAVAGIVQQAFVDSWGQGLEQGSQDFQNKFIDRQHGVAHIPAYIVTLTPEVIPYQGIENFLAIPTYFIPRVFWPQKPVLSKGIWFSITYLKLPYTTASSSAMTVFGEGYIFSGWSGVVIVGLSIGFLYGIIYKATMQAGLEPVLIALTPAFIDIEGQFSTLVVGLVQHLLVYLLVYWILTGVLAAKQPGSARPSRFAYNE